MENIKRVKWIKHYNSSQKILLVGEGDFSFSACLARAFRSATNMVATSLHSEEWQPIMHWSSEAHLEELKRLGCLILHDIDVYEMGSDTILTKMNFDRIIFNFPHAGHFPDLCERHTELIEMHKELLSYFFKNAKGLLNKDGEVHVTHREDYPYDHWKVTKLAKKEGLHLFEKVEFQKSDYPGYHNKRGGDIKSNQTFPLGNSFTFKFTLHVGDDEPCESSSDEDDLCEILSVLRL